MDDFTGLPPESVRETYAHVDRAIDDRLRIDVGFDALIGAARCTVDAPAMAAWAARYAAIKSFQEGALDLFAASLRGDRDPALARMVLGDLPEAFGVEYHRRLSERQHRTPVFFRTDEVAPGKLSEIQCSGSGWDLVELLREVYARSPELYGRPEHFEVSLAERFATALRASLGRQPLVHHLVENASRPHGMRYFIQRTRDHGIRYFGYDRGVHPNDCNFVRSHDFPSLLHNNFFAARMALCDEGKVRFDLPPSALFDGKLIMAWPFWSRTREHFGDEVRDLFPFTAVLDPDGVELEDGERVGLDELAGRPQGARDYFVKYAGTDVSLNWGSRAVYLASSMSVPAVRRLMGTIREDWSLGRCWVLQRAIRRKERVAALTRDGSVQWHDAYAKWSAFYGPDGLMGILTMHKSFHKVHGSADTVMSIVY
jgi:hypothetical protein